LSFPGDSKAHDALHPGDKCHEPTVDVRPGLVLCLLSQAMPTKPHEELSNGGQREEQKKKDADKGTNGTHAGRFLQPRYAGRAIKKARRDAATWTLGPRMLGTFLGRHAPFFWQEALELPRVLPSEDGTTRGVSNRGEVHVQCKSEASRTSGPLRRGGRWLQHAF